MVPRELARLPRLTHVGGRRLFAQIAINTVHFWLQFHRTVQTRVKTTRRKAARQEPDIKNERQILDDLRWSVGGDDLLLVGR